MTDRAVDTQGEVRKHLKEVWQPAADAVGADPNHPPQHTANGFVQQTKATEDAAEPSWALASSLTAASEMFHDEKHGPMCTCELSKLLREFAGGILIERSTAAEKIGRLRKALDDIEAYAANHQDEFSPLALGEVITLCQLSDERQTLTSYDEAYRADPPCDFTHPEYGFRCMRLKSDHGTGAYKDGRGFVGYPHEHVDNGGLGV